MRQLLLPNSGPLQPEQVADAGRSRDQSDKLRSVRRRTKTYGGLIAGGPVGLGAVCGVECAKVRLALLRVNRNDRLAVGRPDRRSSAATARRGVIAADARAQIKIKITREVSRLSIRGEIHHPKIRFGV